MRKVAVVDFDGVLFDAGSFKEDFFALFERFGIPPERNKEAYEEAKLAGYYNADAHLGALRQDSAEVELLKKRVLGLLEDTSRHLFRDATPFLMSLHNHGYLTYILSAGTPWFQDKKIANSGAAAHVEEVYVTEEPEKVAAFGCIYRLGWDTLFFIDDTARVVETLKMTFPKITALQLRRTGATGRAAENCDGIVGDLGKDMEERI